MPWCEPLAEAAGRPSTQIGARWQTSPGGSRSGGRWPCSGVGPRGQRGTAPGALVSSDMNGLQGMCCGNPHCDAVFPDLEEGNSSPRKACPNCGSSVRHFGAHLFEPTTLHQKLAVKAKHPGSKRAFLESVAGDDLHRDSGNWSHVERVIDRSANRYRERIVSENGEVVREVDEPLTAHRGRGSAKARARP